MSIVPTVTAPDFRDLGKDVPRLAPVAGATLELLVLSVDRQQCVGVDLSSGALVRAWWDERPDRSLRPYDVVLVTLAHDPEAVPDPSEPEGLALEGSPERVGHITGRRAEKRLRPLVHPDTEPLLGSHAPAIPFWQRRPDHPSIALVEPQGQIVLRREPAYLACRFAWMGAVRELPCLDRRMAGEMDRDGQIGRIADRRTRLLVALTPPIDGHCHKVVSAVLPRP
jgi:hypothetical protein